ncbi:MAG: Hsp20 family protein [Bacteroidales bacterium]|nr:Hsp20 family protein [Bacteroidales bacterium]
MLTNRNNQLMMPSLFNELLNWDNWTNTHWDETSAVTKMNVSESDNDYLLELTVPGLKKEDLNLSLDADGNLVIEMVKEQKSEEKDEKRNYLRREFGSIQFKRVMALPENVKKDKISAKVEDGMLRVTLPKVTEEEKKQLAQHIQID